MHNIQAKILNKLLYAESLSYAQMRPEKVESNHFAYHLDQLIRDKFVVKSDKSYILTPSGLALVDKMSQEKMVVREQPHIATGIDITNDNRQTLLYRRGFQPYINLLGFPLGKVHLEENIATSAARELFEKTGLKDIKLDHRGMVYIEVKKNDILITKILTHVFHGEVKGTPVTTESKRGSSIWDRPENYQPNELTPGFNEIKKLISQNKELFFDEIVVNID